MASLVTNRGRLRILELALARQYAGTPVLPVSYYMALCTNAAVPTLDTNTLSELVQIQTGNGYTDGGIVVPANGTGFDVATEDDDLNKAYIQIMDLQWQATDGPLPASGSGARWAVLTDDNETVASREVLAAFDLVSDRSVSQDQTLTLQDCQVDLTTPS